MNRLQANLLLTLAAMIWGSSFVVQQIGTGELGTITFTGARFLVGALVVLPFAVKQFLRVDQNERKFQSSDWQGLMANRLCTSCCCGFFAAAWNSAHDRNQFWIFNSTLCPSCAGAWLDCFEKKSPFFHLAGFSLLFSWHLYIKWRPTG